MIAVILLCVLICVSAYWAWQVHLKGGHRLPPMYSGLLPIIGHVHKVIGNGTSLWKTLCDVSAESMKKGGVLCVFLGTQLYYCITDPEDALTAANGCLQKHFTYDYAKSWLGDGLITGSGETWKHHRKLLTPAFSLPVMYGFLDIFNSQSRQLVEIIKQEVGKFFNHTIYLRTITLETFCITSFGITGFEDKDFIKKYLNASDGITSIVISRFQNFWLQSDLIFKLSGSKKKQDELVKVVNEMSDKVIQKKKVERYRNPADYVTKSSGIIYKPFLDLLLELSEDNALTDKEVREELDTAIVTGFDTTSTLLTYSMIFLGTYSDIQENVYEEIKQVLTTDRDVGKEDLPKFVYLEAVLKETVRLMTAPVALRYVDKDVKLKNYTMRAGSQCAILMCGVNRDPVWGKDVDEFRPDRWLHLSADPAAFAGFSLGKRTCLGKTYAMISAKIFMVHFLRRYKITADYSKVKLSFDLILKPVSGHEIYLEERV